MAKQIYVKTGKAPLISSIIAGILFLIFGVSLFFLSEGGMPLIFLIIWLVVCSLIIFISIYHLRRYDTNNGLPIAQIGEEIDFDQKLRKLEALKKEEIISNEEYSKKRQEIMREKW